ncbi:alkaline phosphatase family protein [Propionivibrio sp.]|uniref:alkaline phosphatase family protein n=1 Tax=Propionivibrio sp. TaxID=2212460 RepID=UPI003BF04337
MSQSCDDHNNKPALQPSIILGLSRRDFLQATVAMAGSVLLPSCGGGSGGGSVGGSVGGSSPSPDSALPPPLFANIKNLVVVMFENRSFDNLLGYLYSQGATPANWNGAPIPPPVPLAPDGKPQQFAGVWQLGNTTSPCKGTAGCNTHSGSTALAYPYPTGTDNLPAPDPYEPWEHVRTQVFGIDRALEPGDKPTMSGFLRNYADRLLSYTPALTLPPKASVIMGCYTPDQLPVLSALAQNFAVFDHWYCAVPSQTYCNRAFFHASTSYGYVTNSLWTKWETAPANNNTIFDVLEKQSSKPDAPWGVYFSGSDPGMYTATGDPDNSTVTDYVGLTGLVHYDVGTKYGPSIYPNKDKVANAPQRFFGFDQFFSDVANGNLPQYTFIETLGGSLEFPPFLPDPPPKKSFDYHPPKPPGDGGNGTRSVLNGEEVLRQIYEAIRTSGANGAHDYTQDTMLLVVFDEHGGTYDHIPPPKGIPPGGNSPPESPDFNFDWLGVRVPAIAISSYTMPGTIINDEMHHAAVIKTLLKMNPGAVTHLTERDKPPTVADLSLACNGARSSISAPWPEIKKTVV